MAKRDPSGRFSSMEEDEPIGGEVMDDDTTLIKGFGDAGDEPEEAEKPTPEEEEEAPEEGATLEGEGEEEEEEPKATEEPAEEPPLELDARHKQAARRAHLTDEQVEAMGDGAVGILGQLAEEFDRMSTEYGRLGQPGTARDAAPPVARRPVQRPPEPQPRTASEDVLAQPLSLEFDDEVVGEDLTKGLAPVAGYVNALVERVRQMEQTLAEADTRSIGVEIDRFFNSEAVKEDFGSMFGEGPVSELDEYGAENAARVEVVREADAIAAGAASQGRPMTVEEALERAVSMVSKKRSYAAARKDVTAKLKARSKRTLQRPTARRTARKFATPEKKAEDSYAKRAAELGHETGPGSEGT